MKKHLVKLIAFIFLAFIVFTPFTTIAQYDTDDPGRPGQIVGVQSVCRSDGLGQIICKIHELLNSIIPVLLALGVVYFIWGVVNYVIADDEEAKSKGKERILYGIIGLAIIVSVWGLVQILVTTFGLSASAPTLEVATGSGSSCRDSMADNPNLADLFGYVTCFIGKSVIPLIFALATAMFVWGVVQFVIYSEEEDQKTKGKQFMIWGVIALTVMLSVWSLVGILGKTFGLNTSVLPKVSPN